MRLTQGLNRELSIPSLTTWFPGPKPRYENGAGVGVMSSENSHEQVRLSVHRSLSVTPENRRPQFP